MKRTVEVDLGDGLEFEVLTITVQGAPCKLEKAQAAVSAALVQVKRDLKSKPAPERKPCGGCPDAA